MGCLKLVGGGLDNWGFAIAVNGEDGKTFSNLFLNTLTEEAVKCMIAESETINIGTHRRHGFVALLVLHITAGLDLLL